MTPLFTNIEDLKAVVKINAAMPWESIAPYVDEATMMLDDYFSSEFLQSLTATDVFWSFAKKAVGPMALYLAMDEMAVSVGDAGITVINERDGKRAPASDQKIAAAKRSLHERAMANLSRLISLVMLHGEADYPQLGTCPVVLDFKGLLVNSMHSVMKRVNIMNDYVTMVRLLPLFRTVQRDLGKIVGEALIGEMTATTALPADKLTLRALCKDYIVFRAAYIHTSQTTRVQRSAASSARGGVEWEPMIRPLFTDVEDSGNYYKEEADKALADIEAWVVAASGEGDGASAGPKRLRHTARF